MFWLLEAYRHYFGSGPEPAPRQLTPRVSLSENLKLKLTNCEHEKNLARLENQKLKREVQELQQKLAEKQKLLDAPPKKKRKAPESAAGPSAPAKKEKRQPSMYNMFLSEAMGYLRAELPHEDNGFYMSTAAAMWTENKLAIQTGTFDLERAVQDYCWDSGTFS